VACGGVGRARRRCARWVHSCVGTRTRTRLPAHGQRLSACPLRGALDLDLDWRNAELECQGGLRPDGTGLRISSPVRSTLTDGARGWSLVSRRRGKVAKGHELPTIYDHIRRRGSAIRHRGDDHCTVDTLTQERLGALGGHERSYRVIARGFCVAPASTLDNSARILVSRFDFAGAVVFVDEAR